MASEEGEETVVDTGPVELELRIAILLNDLDLVQQVGLMSTALNGSHARRVIPTNDFSTHDP